MRFWLFFLFLPIILRSQGYSESNFGIHAGMVLDLGSHENEVGLEINSFCSIQKVQLNAGTRFSFLFNSLGKRRKAFEQRMNFGFLFLGGKRETTPEAYFSGLIHNSSYNNAVGYNYIWYFDNVGTSQRSGAFGLTIKKSSIFFENDVFGGQSKDRFRTGHLLYSFREGTNRFNLGVNLWTGETSGTPWIKTNKENCLYGYKNLAQMPFGKTSHGIFYFGIQSQLPFNQYFRFRIGYDSEEIRHLFQNRLTHDLIFLPKSVPHNTPHYPRLDQMGNPVFYKKERRKDLFYIQLGANGNWSE